MKTSTMKCLSLLVSVSLIAGCASNTQNENTAVGAGTGAVAGGLLGTLAKGAGRGTVIGVAAVLGAVIGGYIGHSMDSTDVSNTNTAMENPKYKPMSWKNESSNRQYSVKPTSGIISFNGYDHCRTYQATTVISHQKQVTTGTACLFNDGQWYAM